MLEEEGILFAESGRKILPNFFVEGESSTLLPNADLKQKSKTATMTSGKRKVENEKSTGQPTSRTKKSEYFDSATDIEATIKEEILKVLQKRDVGKTC